MDIRAYILALLCIGGLFDTSPAQSLSRRDKKHQAVNQYVNFANEVVHALWDVHVKLEAFNASANHYIESGNRGRLSFSISDVIKDFELHTSLKGVCSAEHTENGPVVNIQDLYQATTKGNGHIPENYRIALNTQRDALMSSLIELLSLCDTLVNYTQKEVYRKEPLLATVYATLKRCGELYVAFHQQKEALAQVVDQLMLYTPDALDELRSIMTHTRFIIRSIRIQDTATVRIRIQHLGTAIAAAEEGKLKKKASMKDLDLYYNQENTGFSHLIEYARQVQRRALAFLDVSWYSPPFRVYGKPYYYHNERMLALFNHHKYGMTAYYNRFISFANVVLIKELEEIPLFHILPAPSPPSVAVEEIPVSPPANIPEPNLEGAAANNMIFLLDVSASMDRPEKLPLLKRTMNQLVDLMRKEDQIGIVIYSGEARVMLDPTSAYFKAEIRKAIDNLRTGGRTRAKQGFKEAYRLAEKHYIPGGNNRIIFASDGAFEINPAISRLIERKSDNGIQLSVFLFNKLELPRVAEKLSLLANTGGGNYMHIIEENAYPAIVKEAKAVRRN